MFFPSIALAAFYLIELMMMLGSFTLDFSLLSFFSKSSLVIMWTVAGIWRRPTHSHLTDSACLVTIILEAVPLVSVLGVITSTYLRLLNPFLECLGLRKSEPDEPADNCQLRSWEYAKRFCVLLPFLFP